MKPVGGWGCEVGFNLSHSFRYLRLDIGNLLFSSAMTHCKYEGKRVPFGDPAEGWGWGDRMRIYN